MNRHINNEVQKHKTDHVKGRVNEESKEGEYG
jgi:hypothetical protein